MNWLNTELDGAVQAVKQAHLDRLAAVGVPIAAIARLGMIQPPFGAGKIRLLPGCAYEPDPDGVPALVIPVTTPVWFDIWDFELETIEIHDLIAVPTARPAAWRWRIGDGRALGGQQLIDHMDYPVRLVATPLEWLAQAGQAVCVLDWSDTSPIWPLLHYGPDLIVDDNALRTRLQAALRRTAPSPRFWRSSDAA